MGHAPGYQWSVTRAILVALAANLGIALAKLVAFVFTGSSAMLAEAAHSIADSGNELVLLRGGARAAQPANAEHPFGYGGFRFFNAFLVAIGIFSMGGVFALYEGTHRLLDRHPVEQPAWAIGVLLLSGALEGFSLRTAVSRAEQLRAGRGWWQFIRTTKTPDLAVVLLEDFGALVGLAFALVGVTASVVTGDGLWDGVGTLAIGVLLVAIAVVLARETRSLLLGEAAGDRVVRLIEAALAAPAAVVRTSDVRTMHLSPDQLLVVAVLEFAPMPVGADLVAAIDDAARRVREAVRYDCLIYLQPRLDVGAHRAEPQTSLRSD